MLDADDTIVAPASAPGGALRGIVRLSGPQALNCAAPLIADETVRRRLAEFRKPTRLEVRLMFPEFTTLVDCDLFIWPGSRSYTRAPTVELHLLGSPPILESAIAAVCSHGARPARPGEFTLRAFLSGRIDLTQAEAVLGVIDAGDRRQLDAALDQLAGGLGRPLAALRGDLLDLLAELEAGLDFVEEDIEFVAREELVARLRAAADMVRRIVDQLGARGMATTAPRVVLVGAPNAGKSSLFNALVGRSAALVSPVAGTTRDYVTAELEIAGQRVELVDTAGLAATKLDLIDDLAQRAGAAQTKLAQLTLVCHDAAAPPGEAAEFLKPHTEGEATIVVWTKVDLPAHPANARLLRSGDVCISAATGRGLQQLIDAVAAKLAASAAGEVVASTAVRCRDSLTRAAQALASALQLAEQLANEELIAAELRHALDDLGQVLGAVYTDDILDRIFSRFCIGK